MSPMLTTQDQLVAALADKEQRVWGYCRVSTEKQDEGQSPEAQQQAIIDYCAKHHLKAPMVVFEVGSAGKPMIPVTMPGGAMLPVRKDTTNPRPLFAMLINHLCKVKNCHLIVWKLDRFSRVSYEQEIFLELLSRSDVKMHSTQEAESNILADDKGALDPQRAFFRQIMGAVAQYERALIAGRMRMGTIMKASKGGWVGGTVPFGYEVKDSDITPKEADAHIVRLIFYLREQLDYSSSAIAEHLNNVYPSKVTNTDAPSDGKRKKTKAAPKYSYWHKMRVGRILNNRKLYMGTYSDPFGGVHARPELRILPESLSDWHESLEIVVAESPEPTFTG